MQSAVSFSSYLVTLPFDFFRWWLVEATLTLVNILLWFFAFFFQILGVKSLFKTFFTPWKNEYREGLVGFSIFMGILMKSIFLTIDIFFFFFLLVTAIIVFLAWVLTPFVILWGFYATFSA